jgi:hypothetical protein
VFWAINIQRGCFWPTLARRLFSKVATRWTALARNLAGRVVCLVLFFVSLRFILYFQRRDNLRAAWELIGKGGQAEGVILEKYASSDQGEGVDFYYLTYRFAVPTGAPLSAPVRLFGGKVMVSEDLFNHIAVGQTTTVHYDRDDPSRSVLDASAQNPVIGVGLVGGWWIISVAVVGYNLILFLAERTLATRGLLIQGSVCELSQGWADDEGVCMQLSYTFRSPSGKKVEGTTRGPRRKTNLGKMSPPITKDYPVAVLYLNDKSFRLL